ncbi:MAG: hypothetical protein EXX96DRAFT_554944 [Benjaminiella poitrasii]|nr:MAG: hypothetical protein EXX96DRAFT_554944 [Benjaminiella poitrasii]
MAEFKTQHWVMLSLGIAVVLLITISIIYYYVVYKGKKRRSSHDDEKDIGTAKRTAAELSIPDDIDEAVVIFKGTEQKHPTVQQRENKKREEEAYLYGQQFALVTSAQTNLSPPRPQQQKTVNVQDNVVCDIPIRDQKQFKNLSIPENEDDIDHSKKLRVFSLSPLHMPLSESPCSEQTPSNHNCSVCSRGSVVYRTLSPYTPSNLNDVTWRGPTPPWTQYPGRQ